MHVTVLSESPRIITVDNFLRDIEIAEILDVGTPLLQPSLIQTRRERARGRGRQKSGTYGFNHEQIMAVAEQKLSVPDESGDGLGMEQEGVPDIDPRVTKHAKAFHESSSNTHVHRRSSTAFLGDTHAYNALLVAVQKRVSLFTGIDWRHSECLQFVRYETGDFFREHTDYFSDDDQYTDMAAGQRIYTALLYLNEDFIGGATDFPLLNISVVPKKGRMLLFKNTVSTHELYPSGNCHGNKGRPDPRTLHKGAVVTQGRKYACNLWVLERPFDVYRSSPL